MKLKSLLFGMMMMAALSSFGQVLTFTVRTTSIGPSVGGTNTEFTPKHVLVMWITNSTNTFVKTIDYHAGQRVQYLTNWIASTPSKNTTGVSSANGTSGATLTTHPTTAVTKTWDCTNVSGTVVPNGTYYINVEYTEGDATGLLKKIPFTIGPASSTPVANDAHFFDMNVSLTQSAQTAVPVTSDDLIYDIHYLPNAKVVEVKYNTEKHQNVVAEVFDSKGEKVAEQYLQASTSVVVNNLPKGNYIIKVKDAEGIIATKKFVSK